MSQSDLSQRARSLREQIMEADWGYDNEKLPAVLDAVLEAGLQEALKEKESETEQWKQLKAEADTYLAEVRQSHFKWQQRAEQAEAALTSAQAEIADLKKERTELHAHCDENGI